MVNSRGLMRYLEFGIRNLLFGIRNLVFGMWRKERSVEIF